MSGHRVTKFNGRTSAPSVRLRPRFPSHWTTMSRRKQAKPRAVKRDPEDEDDDAVSMATESGRDQAPTSLGSDCGPSSPISKSSDTLCSPDGEKDTMDCDVTKVEPEGGTGTMDEEEHYRCGTCNGVFYSLVEFMDHRNYECSSGEIEMEVGESPADSPNMDNPVSPSTPNMPVDLLPHSIGVDSTHPYPCSYCDKAFEKTSLLKRHEQVHSDLLPFRCDLCPRVFKHRKSRDKHVKLHAVNKDYRCPSCSATFTRFDHLKAHMKSEHRNRGHQCSICHMTFMTSSSLTSHMWSHKVEDEKVKTEKSTTLHELLVQGLPDDFQPMTKARAIQCPYCAEICLGKQSMEFHFEQHHPGEKFKCPVCNAGYSLSDDLLNHLRTQHDYPSESPPMLERPLSKSSSDTYMVTSFGKHDCPFCDKGGFSSADVLEIHVRTLHADKLSHVNICSYCNTIYPTLPELEDHIKMEHGNSTLKVKFACEICSQECSSYESLQLHKDSVHFKTNDLYANDLHPNDYYTKSSDYKDLTSKMDYKTVHCSICTLPFNTLTSLSEHIFTSHGISIGSKSPSPGVVSTSSAGSKRYLDSTPKHSPARPSITQSPKLNRPSSNTSSSGTNDTNSWTCDQCNATFLELRSFQAHMKLHTECHQYGKHTCSHCTARFPSEELLENHVFIHYLSQTTEYGCTSCMKLFAKPDELQKHLMDIHAHHLYRCALCKEVFDSKVNIQVHFAIKHSNECQLYKCTTCGSVFRSEMEWQLHVKVQHLGISKPYRCLFCKESFSSDVDLQCHLTTHKKPFACPLCDEAFHVEYLLDKHIQTHHNPDNEKKIISLKEDQPEALDFSYTATDKLCAVSQTMSGVTTSISVAPVIKNSHSPLIKKGELIHKCDICDVKFSDESSLQKHRMHDHSISPEMSIMIQKAHQQVSPSIINSKITTSPDKFSQLCVYCNQTFKTKSELEKHMKSHVTPSSQKCNICDEVFPSPFVLAEHKLTHCKIVKGNVCVVCKVAMKSEEQFYSHAQQHGYQGTSMQCIVCRQTLSSMLELQMHGKHHFQGSTAYHTCCVCLKAFSSKENLISKLNTSGRSYYVCKPCYHGDGTQEHRCSTCGVKFETQAQLDTHSLQHKKTYQCIKCQQSFSTEYEIQVHVATHVMQEGNIHECKMCNSHYDSPAKLQAHLIEHTYENASEMRCVICQALFTHVSAIQMHVLEHGLAARQYSCSQCHQKFFFSAELQNHLLTHVPTTVTRASQDLTCNECNKTFSSVITLNTHRRTHEKDTSPRCSICALTFTTMADLQQHFFAAHVTEPGEHIPGGTGDKVKRSPRLETTQERSSNHKVNNTGKENRRGQGKNNSTAKPVPCMICGKTFAKKSHVKDHMKIHFAQANIFQCDYCSETFNQSALLQRHLEDSHGKADVTYVVTCHVCADDFPSTAALTCHLLQVHGITKLEPNTDTMSDPENSDSNSCGKPIEIIPSATLNGSHLESDDSQCDKDFENGSINSKRLGSINGKIDNVAIYANASEQVAVK